MACEPKIFTYGPWRKTFFIRLKWACKGSSWSTDDETIDKKKKKESIKWKQKIQIFSKHPHTRSSIHKKLLDIWRSMKMWLMTRIENQSKETDLSNSSGCIHQIGKGFVKKRKRKRNRPGNEINRIRRYFF